MCHSGLNLPYLPSPTTLLLLVYHSVSMNYLPFSLMLPGLCLCCCSFYLEGPCSLIRMITSLYSSKPISKGTFCVKSC